MPNILQDLANAANVALDQLVQVAGVVKDQATGEPIANVEVHQDLAGYINGTTTNADGAYSLPAVPVANIHYSHVAYQEKVIGAPATDTVVNVAMVPAVVQLPEVTITPIPPPARTPPPNTPKASTVPWGWIFGGVAAALLVAFTTQRRAAPMRRLL